MEKHEAAGTTEDPEYQGAIAAFFKEYVLRIEPWPKDFMHTLELFGTDPTVYHTMYVLLFLPGASLPDEVLRAGWGRRSSTSRARSRIGRSCLSCTRSRCRRWC